MMTGEPWPSLYIPPPRTSTEQEAWPGSAPSFSELADLCRKYAVTEENVVTAEVVTAQDLADLLTDQLRKAWNLAPDRPRGRQELTCAADVSEALAALMPEKAWNLAPGANSFIPMPTTLIDILVIVSEDSAPGTWRLVTHDHCEVRDVDEPGRKPWVSHAECSITAEGCLT